MEKYNGWTNYPTWNVKLWMDNDEGEYNYWREQAQEVFDQAESDEYFTKKERAALDLADVLKEYFDENNPLETGTHADLLGWALGMVDWKEIADSLLEDFEDESETEEEQSEDE